MRIDGQIRPAAAEVANPEIGAIRAKGGPDEDSRPIMGSHLSFFWPSKSSKAAVSMLRLQSGLSCPLRPGKMGLKRPRRSP